VPCTEKKTNHFAGQHTIHHYDPFSEQSRVDVEGSLSSWSMLYNHGYKIVIAYLNPIDQARSVAEDRHVSVLFQQKVAATPK